MIGVGGASEGADLEASGLDEAADKDEETAENVLCQGEGAAAGEPEGGTLARIGSFQVPTAHVLVDQPDSVGPHLRRVKMAHKFESGWQTGTYHGVYKGSKGEYQGFSVMYLD